MKVEFHGVAVVVALVLGTVCAAFAVRLHQWPLAVIASGLFIYSFVSTILVIRHVTVLMNGSSPRADDQRGPEEVAGDGDVPGLGCGERRRVDSSGRATSTARDPQP